MESEKALCPSKKEDGDQCGFELAFSFKWCPECGARVRPAWFQQKEAEIMVAVTQADVYTRHIPNPTISSVKTESGNPVTQNEVLPISGEETKDTNENADTNDIISEGGENDIVDVLEERELQDKGANEDIIPNVKEDKDKEVYVEKELLSEEEGRMLDKRKERDKGFFGIEGKERGTGNSEESYDDRQKDAVDMKRNEEKDIFEPGTYQENERKESDSVEEIKNEEIIDFDIKSEDKEKEIIERRMDANKDKENWKGKEAFDKEGYIGEREGPESFHTLEMLGDQIEGEIPRGKTLDDKTNDDNVNVIIEDKKEGPLTENDEDRLDVSYEKGRGAKGEITIYQGHQGETDGKRKAEEGGDLERMEERIEKKRKVDGKTFEENKGNETTSNESESQGEGDNGNEKKKEKEGNSEEKGEEDKADFDPSLQPSDENTSFCSGLAECNRSSFKGYNDIQTEQDVVTTDTAQHEEGMGNGREVNAGNVKTLVDKGLERKIMKET